MKIVWIVNHRNKFITRFYSYIILVITSRQCDESQHDVPTVSDENVCPRKLDIREFLVKKEILNDISRKNLLYNVFQPDEGFTFPTKQLHGWFRSFNFKLWTEGYPFLVYSRSMDSVFVCCAFYLQHNQHPCSINYQVLAGGTKREKRRRSIATPVLTKNICQHLKTSNLDLVILI